MDVALVTCLELPEPDHDAAPLLHALTAAGLSSTTLAWDDPKAEWHRARVAVLRSTWNYPLRPQAFLDWAERTAAVTKLLNPFPVVRWNLHKRYLLDLAARGVEVIATALVERGSKPRLAALLAERGWSDIVIKPAISAASYRTRRVQPGELAAGEAHLEGLLADGDALVQPYLTSVSGYGERSLIWIDGEITHAVRKSPRFAGGSEQVASAGVAITPAEAALAARVIAAAPGPLLYARIDMAPDADGRPLLMECELIEPSLFLTHSPTALERFVRAVKRRAGAR